MVHRNLILDVSLLPISEQTDTEPDSGTPDEISEFQPQPLDVLSCLAEDNSQDRTRTWMSMSLDVDCVSLEEDRESEEQKIGSQKSEEQPSTVRIYRGW